MKKLYLLLPFVALLTSCSPNGNSSPCPVLTVEGGQISGVKVDLEKEGTTTTIYEYKGIPYAAAPIGDLRWKEPQPVVAWEGVRNCDKFGHPGYQAVHYPGFYASEWGYGDEALHRREPALYAFQA